jgi:hypothetical protein
MASLTGRGDFLQSFSVGSLGTAITQQEVRKLNISRYHSAVTNGSNDSDGTVTSNSYHISS